MSRTITTAAGNITVESAGSVTTLADASLVVKGTTNFSNNPIENMETATYNSEVANTGAAQTINWTAAQKQLSTLSANVTYTFTAPPGPGNFLLRIVQSGAGGWTATWPATVKWTGGVAPVLSTAVGAVDIISFYWNGTNYYGVASLAFA